jgi:hypothetical protein
MMITDETAIAVANTQEIQTEPHNFSLALTADDVVRQLVLVQEVMKRVMKEGTHYGTIQGCGDKPSLFQPGAQVLALTFGFAPTYERDIKDLGNGHREYSIVCTLVSRQSGLKIGAGVGSCSTMESKYRYRSGTTYLDIPVPKEWWTTPKEERNKTLAARILGGTNRSIGKDPDGNWVITEKGDRTENPDIADQYNTVLKMAKKRAYVDAVLTATAASDMFTQDLEDIAANRGQEAPQKASKATPTPQKNPYLNAVGNLAQEYQKITGTPLKDITKMISDRLGMPLHTVSNSDDADQAYDIIYDLINAENDGIIVEMADEDIPF